jgi:hypothetical protein
MEFRMTRLTWVVLAVVGLSCGGGTVREPPKQPVDGSNHMAEDALADFDAAPEGGASVRGDASGGDASVGDVAGSDAAPEAVDAAPEATDGAATSDASDAPAADQLPDAPDGATTDTPDVAADAPGDATEGPPPRTVTVAFTGDVATVVGTPFGFDGTVRLAPVAGSFTYDPDLPDDLPSDPKRGHYDRGRTAFTFTVKTHSITGSGTAILETEDLNPDTFRFIDGTQLDQVPRVMKLDGTAAPAVELFIAITDGTGAMLTSDVLPDPFPTLDLTSFQTAVTFSLKDGSGTLLMHLDALRNQ